MTYGKLPLSLSSAATPRYSTLTLVAPVAALIFLILHAEASRACLHLAILTGLVVLTFTVIVDRKQMISAGASRFYYSSLQQILLDDKKIGPWEQMLLGRKSLEVIQYRNGVLRRASCRIPRRRGISRGFGLREAGGSGSRRPDIGGAEDLIGGERYDAEH